MHCGIKNYGGNMKVTENIYLLESTRGSYCYLIKADETVLIDTGLPFRGKVLLRELETLGVAPQSIKHILLTHHELDHIGNVCMLQKLTGAKVWASKNDIPYITGQSPWYGFKKYMNRIMHVKKPEHVNVLSESETVAGVRVIDTPGHTPGHVCFLYRGALFAGDLVEYRKGKLIPYPAPWSRDMPSLLQSIKKVRQYEFDWICPAHGRPLKRTAPLCEGEV
jgi:glyoxylase-like metal-dependent hydrolase (beta-lactamase superfamily II)